VSASTCCFEKLIITIEISRAGIKEVSGFHGVEDVY
jgi:hypothetical protein